MVFYKIKKAHVKSGAAFSHYLRPRLGLFKKIPAERGKNSNINFPAATTFQALKAPARVFVAKRCYF